MTVAEQLSIWAASPGGEILMGITYDDKPYVVQRMKARDALAGFERLRGNRPDRVMQAAWERAALAGFERRNADIDVARVADLNGVTCVVIEGRLSGPDTTYRAVLSSAEPFL